MNTIYTTVSASILTVTVTVSIETYYLFSDLLVSSYNQNGFGFSLFRSFIFEILPMCAKFFIKTFWKKLKTSLFNWVKSLVEAKIYMYLVA